MKNDTYWYRRLTDINNKIFDFITWQDSLDGMKANHAKIQESYKHVLFRDLNIRLKQVEEAIYRAVDQRLKNSYCRWTAHR